MISRDQQVVQSYLDELLTEAPPAQFRPAPVAAPIGAPATTQSIASAATPAIAPATTPAIAPATAAVALQEQVQSLEVVKRQQLQALLDRTPPVVAPVGLPEVPAQSVQVEVAEPVAPPVAEPEPVAVDSPLLKWCDNGRPVWAQRSFDVLLFRVAGLTLAVPIIALGQIYPITDGLTPLFGQAEWFMGLQPTPTGRLRTVNTALFVMPERYDPRFVQSARYVVSIDGLDWGLAVDEVQQPIRLAAEDVTWRSERSKRPWLAGTVKTAMCALLDVPQMGRLLEGQDRKRAGAVR